MLFTNQVLTLVRFPIHPVREHKASNRKEVVVEDLLKPSLIIQVTGLVVVMNAST